MGLLVLFSRRGVWWGGVEGNVALLGPPVLFSRRGVWCGVVSEGGVAVLVLPVLFSRRGVWQLWFDGVKGVLPTARA